MTVEVFDSLASSQGLQKSGWFAKIVKDKFNIKLNIIAPNVSGGDTVFDTRSASGNLGDLVIVGTGNGRLNKLVKAKHLHVKPLSVLVSQKAWVHSLFIKCAAQASKQLC